MAKNTSNNLFLDYITEAYSTNFLFNGTNLSVIVLFKTIKKSINC